MEQVDCVVVGAGVVGLAIARALGQAGREVLVLEACDAIGTQTSARNSEVIHAGIYYPQGSLKAHLCVRGKELLYAYCAERSLPHQRCGKLIVATDAAQLTQLQGIQAKAAANGVNDLVMAGRGCKRARWSLRCECLAALHSPSTGIVDSHALMLSLLGDVEAVGGVLALNSPLARMDIAPGAIELKAVDGTHLRARTVVNAAGHGAPALAARHPRLASEVRTPRLFRQRQLFHAWRGAARFPV